MTNAIPPEPEQRPPVRGWLLVLCLWMTVFPAVLLGPMIIVGAAMASPAGSALLFVGAAMLTFSAPAMVIGTLLWMRKRAGLIAAKVYFAAFLILGSVSWIILASVGWFWLPLPAMLADMGKDTTELVALVAVYGPWLMYLKRSKRVRATFAPPTGQRPPMGSIMQVAPQANPVSSEGKCAARGPVQPSASTSDNEIYEIVANEIDAGNVSKGLWTRLYAEAEGDENKTKVLYIKHRSAELLAVRDQRVAQAAADAAELLAARDRRPAQEAADKAAAADAADRAREANVFALARSWAISPEDAESVLAYGISKAGARFAYGFFRYDKLSDAIAHARNPAGMKRKSRLGYS